MFRQMTGYRASYHDLKLLVVSEFNEWRVLLHGPDATIQGIRQFDESKAKQHALDVARHYCHEHKQTALPVLEKVDWAPTVGDDWLIWLG